ncbi:low molecular weight protein-tyrosine-phosphatase [Paraburkholderia nodosa]|uniref:low molecular weight protein-tyrosine-phosphatase n=1 Tax=Paraburkholderia nodosa TaxID=392320 RepID=UPI000841B244|nr:low molecular weight protein-tyrosine-phosphatase [Paraburkholderia nodosa]
MMNSILVVCEGNLCRSPMAAAMLGSLLKEQQVASAGLNALVGMPAAQYACDVMRERGHDITGHRATQIARSLCSSADVILAMDGAQKRQIESQFSFTRGRVFRLGEFLDIDVEDPYRRPKSEFERCAELISVCLTEWTARFSAL